jgi:hypothetical protein
VLGIISGKSENSQRKLIVLKEENRKSSMQVSLSKHRINQKNSA